MVSIKVQGSNFLQEHAIYTESDRIYRFIRDKVLTKMQYGEILSRMMVSKRYKAERYISNLFMPDDDLLDLSHRGPTIGLHSYSHPTMIHQLPHVEQELEYSRNMKKLTEICGRRVKSMSHPCGRYNEYILNVLKTWELRSGSALMYENRKQSILELPRNDHMNILRAINS